MTSISVLCPPLSLKTQGKASWPCTEYESLHEALFEELVTAAMAEETKSIFAKERVAGFVLQLWLCIWAEGLWQRKTVELTAKSLVTAHYML